MSEQEPKTKVVILTHRYRISGKIAHFADDRLADYLLELKAFVAVTEATVETVEGTHLFHSAFVNVRRDSIDVITPVETITT